MKPKLYDQYRRLVLQTYGHSWLITLDQLAAAGLLVQSTGTRPSYSILCKRLGLIVDNLLTEQ